MAGYGLRRRLIDRSCSDSCSNAMPRKPASRFSRAAECCCEGRARYGGPIVRTILGPRRRQSDVIPVHLRLLGRAPRPRCDSLAGAADPRFQFVDGTGSSVRSSPRRVREMPILPLDHLEPFAATLGVMLYPGSDPSDQRRARAFAARFLSEPMRRFGDAGHSLPAEALLQLLRDAGGAFGEAESLDDVDARWWAGTATGEMTKAYFILADTEPERASWNNAARLAEDAAARDDRPRSRNELWAAKREFLPVAHLWGAWMIRGGCFGSDDGVGYDGWTDFQFFLAEAESLRYWGQNWRPRRDKAEPPLPAEVWTVPDDWRPPERQPGWPMTGVIPPMSFPAGLLEGLRPAGRPMNAS